MYSWAGLGTLATGPSGRQTRLAGWAQLLHLPILPCARLCGPPMPPPPSLPLCPLHTLVRALTCEIKRDFNYLSAKQQLERITAQQRSPPPFPPPGLPSPLHLQPPPRSEGVLQFSSGPLCPSLEMRWSVLGTGHGVQRAVQATPSGRSGGASLCVHTLETASSHLCVCPGIRPSCVGVWLACVNTVCACKQVCNLGQCNPPDEPAVLGKLHRFQQAFTIIACDPER